MRPAEPARSVRLTPTLLTSPKRCRATSIFLAQTPQAFRRDVLRDGAGARRRAAIDATDEATLAERAGHAVRLVEGEATNIKITTPDDLPVAEAIAAQRAAGDAPAAPGTGYDLHRLVEGRPLVLGGVTIPFERGRSATPMPTSCATRSPMRCSARRRLGDIGRHFPDSDPRWKDASSLDLLARAAALVARARATRSATWT